MIRQLLSISAFCCLLHSLQADDWTQYRGSNGDGRSSDSIRQLSWSDDGPRQLWKVDTPNGFSSFSVAHGRAVTMVSREIDGTLTEVCVALNADTGEELWSVPFSPCDYEHAGGDAGARGNRGGDGPRSTPANDGQRVYVYCSMMMLNCLDAATGDSLWKHDIVNEFDGKNIFWRNAVSPVFDDDNVYVCGGGEGQMFLAFNKMTGEPAWKSGNDVMTHATPQLTAIGGRPQLIQFVKSGLVSLDTSTGKELWRSKFEFSTSTAATPVVEENMVYVSAGYSVGSEVLEIETGNGTFKPRSVWYKPNELMNHWSTPVVRDGHLYGIFGFKKYGRAPLECVELATGKIKWSQGGFGPGNVILVGDKLLVLADDGQLVGVEATPDGYKELARTKAVGGKCWSTPAYADGRVYVRSTTEAACLELVGEQP